jgi:ABC-2 type transport system permease protein
MRAIVTLALRELRLLALSPTGSALAAVWCFCVGALFLMDLTAFEQAEQRALAANDPALLRLLDVNDVLIASVLGNVVVLLLFLAPLLAMRLFADDRATRDWLVFAAPRAELVALGKVAAGVIVTTALAASTLALPVLLAAVGQPAPGSTDAVVDVGQTLVACATLAACAAGFVAVACALGAFIDVPLAAGLLSFLVLVVWWLLPGAAPLVGPDVGAWLVHASPASHLERGLRGVVDGGDVVFFAGIVAVATVTAALGTAQGRR